jgi:hypothetical protein
MSGASILYFPESEGGAGRRAHGSSCNFAAPPLGRAKADCGAFVPIGAAAFGRHAASQNGMAHDFPFDRSSSNDRL